MLCVPLPFLTHVIAGVDLHDAHFLEALRLPAAADALPDYNAWLDKNVFYYDPVFRSWRARDSSMAPRNLAASLKCWDERCLHYIYGFSNHEDREHHFREHGVRLKRDSGLSIGSAAPVVFPEQATTRIFNAEPARHSAPVSLPRLSVPPTLAPLAPVGPLRERRDGSIAFPFPSDYAIQHRGSVDSELDPLLPPLKRSRVGHSRLESIGELRLPRDTGPCLRCKVQAKPVGSPTMLAGACRLTVH